LVECPECHHQSPAAAKFCAECGSRLTATPRAALSRDAERRQLTVLFCDLARSTQLASNRDPEDWRNIVAAYQQTCNAVLASFEGHVGQLLGDGILVYFGYPRAHEDDAERAVRAGLAIIEAIGQANATLEEEHGLRLDLRVGIHTGPVVMSEMGSGEHRETLALGSTINMAARLQDVGNDNSVVLSSDTRRLVEDRFEMRDMGTLDLKGLGEARVFEAMRPIGARGRREAETHGLTPLVGRETELALLEELEQRTRGGKAQTALITGEAGLGKTRLVQSLRDRLSPSGLRWLNGRCSPYARNRPFHPIIELVHDAMDFETLESSDDMLAKLEAEIRDAGLSVEEALPLFASLLSLDLPEAFPDPALSPELQRVRTLETLEAWVSSLARRQPLVLLIEDLHWADPTSLAFLGMLIEGEPSVSLLTILTARPEFDAPWPETTSLISIVLDRLTQKESRRLASAVATGTDLPRAALDAIVARAEGNPLYVEELTKGLLESERLHEREGGLVFNGGVHDLAIPATLQGSLMARLDRLAAAKRVAQVAATIGRDFSYSLIRNIAGIGEDTLCEGLDNLVEAGLLFRLGQPPEAAYTFKHALIQDTAYESLLRSDRQTLHGRIADVLEDRSQSGENLEPELLAHHYDGANLFEKAVPQYERAGTEARSRGANLEAIEHFRRGVELTQRLPETPERNDRELALQLGLGSTLHAVDGLATEATHHAWERAHELCASAGSPAQLGTALRGLIAFYDGTSALDTAVELGEQLLELGQRTQTDSHILAAYSGMGVSRFWQGKFQEALTDFDATRAIYDPELHSRLALIHGMDQLVETNGFSGWALWITGFPDQAMQRQEAAVDHARSLDHPYSLAYGLMLSAVSHMTMSHWDHCQTRATECVEVSEQHGFPLFLGVCRVVEALVRAHTNGEDTIDYAMKGVGESSSTGQQSGTPAVLGMLAQIQHTFGRTNEAIGIIDGALVSSAKDNQPFFDAELIRMKGDLLIESNEAAGERCLLDALSLSRSQGARGFELRAATSLADLWKKNGRPEPARELLQAIYASFTEGLDTFDLIQAKALLEEL
jgi:class 3 adenylate cyclase/tetratricopeptide (TPR) repeat protein